jgi:hypothetical protein
MATPIPNLPRDEQRAPPPFSEDIISPFSHDIRKPQILMPPHVLNFDGTEANDGSIPHHHQAVSTTTEASNLGTAISPLQRLPSDIHVKIIRQLLIKTKQDFLDEFTGPPPMHPPFRGLLEEAEYVLDSYLATSSIARRCWYNHQRAILRRIAKARMAMLSNWRRQLRINFIRAKARNILWQHVLQNRRPGTPNLVDHICRAWEEYTECDLLFGLTGRELGNSANYLGN